MPTLLSIYEAGMRKVSKRQWEVDVPVDALQAARVSDVERTYDRLVRQLLSYRALYKSQIDSGWTAVTGYYAAFFAAQTLLSLLGMSARNVTHLPSVKPALYYLAEGPSQYPNQALLTLHGQAQGSHRFLWVQFGRAIDDAIQIPGNDAATLGVLSSVRQLVNGPPSITQSRNLINYSVDLKPTHLGLWASEFAACDSEGKLESRVMATSPVHEGQRFELVALSAASLVRALYADYLGRVPRADRRPAQGRQRAVEAAGQNGESAPWL
jgi:hypothetical protein